MTRLKHDIGTVTMCAVCLAILIISMVGGA